MNLVPLIVLTRQKQYTHSRTSHANTFRMINLGPPACDEIPIIRNMPPCVTIISGHPSSIHRLQTHQREKGLAGIVKFPSRYQVTTIILKMQQRENKCISKKFNLSIFPLKTFLSLVVGKVM